MASPFSGGLPQNSGIGLKSIKEQIDTGSASGRLVFHIFASLAEFERELIRERTFVGLEAARKRGRFGGRRRKLTEKQVRELRQVYDSRVFDVKQMCAMFGVSRSTLYNYLKLPSS